MEGKYQVKFQDGIAIRQLANLDVNHSFDSLFSDKEVHRRLKGQNGNADQINIAKQILASYPNATEIEVRPMANPATAVLMLFALIIALLLAPLAVGLGMHGKLLHIYDDVLEEEEFKKFRTPYMIGGIVWVVSCLVWTVLFFVSKDKVGPTLLMMPIYVWIGVDIGYVAISIIVKNNIYKKHEPEIRARKEAACQATMVAEGNNAGTGMELKPEELACLTDNEIEGFKKLKELVDLGFLTETEFFQKKEEILNRKRIEMGGSGNNPDGVSAGVAPVQTGTNNRGTRTKFKIISFILLAVVLAVMLFVSLYSWHYDDYVPSIFVILFISQTHDPISLGFAIPFAIVDVGAISLLIVGLLTNRKSLGYVGIALSFLLVLGFITMGLFFRTNMFAYPFIGGLTLCTVLAFVSQKGKRNWNLRLGSWLQRTIFCGRHGMKNLLPRLEGQIIHGCHYVKQNVFFRR